MKTLSIRQVAQLKRTAQNVYPEVNKKNKLEEKIAALNAEYEAVIATIDAWESATKAMTGGYTSEDLLIRSVVVATNEDGTPKVDKNGQPVKTTKYEPNPATLVFNEDKNVYEVVEVVEEIVAPEAPSVDFEEKVSEVETPNAFPEI